MKPPPHQDRHAAAQVRGDFGPHCIPSPYRHPLPVSPPPRARRPRIDWHTAAVRVLQVLASASLGAAWIGAAIALRHFTR